MAKKIVAILTGPSTHLDHLGILSAYLDIPLIVVEEKTYELAKIFYPKTKVIYKELADLSFAYLGSKFDVILQSGRNLAFQLSNILNLFQSKQIRFVYCPHGNSDKCHSFTKEEYPNQDISLVYGNHMLDLLRKNGILEKISSTIPTGNYRYDFYLKNQSFYDEIAHTHVFSKLDPKKKTILYAPTWDTREYASSFFTFCSELIEQNQNYNLIIKPHPFLEKYFPAQTWHLLTKYEDHPRKIFLDDFPSIYPLLAKTDIYLGDFSSIGYDFLVFDRPMFFFNTAKTNDPAGLFLHQCGIEIPESSKKDIYGFLEKNIEKNQELSSVRKTIYDYTFDPLISSKELKKILKGMIVSESNRR